MKYVIGITGGVGSGKSIVLDYLKSNHSAAVYQMDEIAKELKESDDIQSQILSAFGTTDPSELSDVIFSDKNKLELINSIIHPAVRKVVDDIVAHAQGLTIIETALPEEGGLLDYCDEIWYIFADKDSRLKRLQNDRGYTKERADITMSNQLSDAEYESFADRIIDNTGTPEQTYIQIDNNLKTLGL